MIVAYLIISGPSSSSSVDTSSLFSEAAWQEFVQQNGPIGTTGDAAKTQEVLRRSRFYQRQLVLALQQRAATSIAYGELSPAEANALRYLLKNDRTDVPDREDLVVPPAALIVVERTYPEGMALRVDLPDGKSHMFLQ
jgi:hypothetical protein